MNETVLIGGAACLKKEVKGASQLAGDTAVVRDQEPLEEGLIDQATGALVGFDVSGVEIAD